MVCLKKGLNQILRSEMILYYILCNFDEDLNPISKRTKANETHSAKVIGHIRDVEINTFCVFFFFCILILELFQLLIFIVASSNIEDLYGGFSILV